MDWTGRDLLELTHGRAKREEGREGKEQEKNQKQNHELQHSGQVMQSRSNKL